MKGITLMLLNCHTVDWRNYCSLIHSPVPNVQHSTSTLSTLLTLVNKYYSLSNTLPSNKKWFSRRITQFNTWTIIELKKWIRTAKIIIPTDNLKKKTTLNNITLSTKIRRYIHKIIPATDIKLIAKRKPTSIISFFNHPKDIRQQHAVQDEYREKNNNNNTLQLKVIQLPLQSSSITSKQKNRYNSQLSCIEYNSTAYSFKRTKY